MPLFYGAQILIYLTLKPPFEVFILSLGFWLDVFKQNMKGSKPASQPVHMVTMFLASSVFNNARGRPNVENTSDGWLSFIFAVLANVLSSL